jgi:hypothetical protein
MAQQSSRERAFESLASVRAYVKANHGSVQKLASLMSEASGERIARHTVSRWLRDKIEKFQQPSLGHALALFESIKTMQTSDQ